MPGNDTLTISVPEGAGGAGSAPGYTVLKLAGFTSTHSALRVPVTSNEKIVVFMILTIDPRVAVAGGCSSTVKCTSPAMTTNTVTLETPTNQVTKLPYTDVSNKRAIQTNNVDVDDRGYIYIVDRANTGMHILQLTGAARGIANWQAAAR